MTADLNLIRSLAQVGNLAVLVGAHMRALELTPPGEEPHCGGPAGCVLPLAHAKGCFYTDGIRSWEES